MIGQLVVAKAMPLLLQVTQGNADRMTPDQQFQIAMESLRRGFGPGTLALLVPFALFGMILGIVWLKYRQRQAQIRVQAEVHKHLLDKFGSGREFAEFLGTQRSQQFLDALWSQRPGPYDYILRTIRTGVVMTVLGFGMLALSWMDGGQGGLRVPAVIVLALGVGFLLSAAISHRLSKQWEQKASTESPRVT
jgi:hypothetical protein